MKIDLHIHTSSGSDGNLSVDEVFDEAKKRRIDLVSITDHDCIDCQPRAIALAEAYGIDYITGVELNVTFTHPPEANRTISLDFLGYGYDIGNHDLIEKLEEIRKHRENRAQQILEKLNVEFDKQGIILFTVEDLNNIQASADGAFGRPHIANYLVDKGIVRSKQEAFDKFLVRCDVPKYPLHLDEASRLIINAGGRLVLAHPNDPNGTSLVSLTIDLNKQTEIIAKYMLEFIDGIECWHYRSDTRTTDHYIEFSRRHNLLMTGGSDCHQEPVLMGTLDIPDWVAEHLRSSDGDKPGREDN